MGRAIALGFSVVVYAFFFAVFLYAIGFIGNVAVPISIDVGGIESPLAVAVAVNGGLLALFAIQHSVMARPAFKRWWTGLVPAPIERTIYVLCSSIAMLALYVGWRPIPSIVWDVDLPALRATLQALYFASWGLLLVATFQLDHFDLFGLKQTWQSFRGVSPPEPRLEIPLLYRFVRHPIYVAWIAIFWITPTMTVGHVLFAALSTAYILVAIPLEERDLVGEFGEAYVDYRRTTPALVPGLRGGGGAR